MSDRLPPQDLHAEQSVLGSVLIDKEALSKISDFLTPDSFYKDAHRLIYEAVLNLFQANQPIDLITVSSELQRLSFLESAGGRVYISDLIQSVPSSANVEYYAHIVQDKAVLRQLISAGSDMVTDAFNAHMDIDEILDKTEKTIFEITQRQLKEGFVPLSTLVDQVMDRLDQHYDNPSLTTGVPTGFVDVDAFTGGFQNSDLIILAARPSMGKTALALNLAQNIAFKQKVPTAIFSLEMSKESLVMRLLCSEAKIDSSRLRSKNLQEHEWRQLSRAVGRLSETPIFIDDSAAINTIELRAKARRMKMEHNIGLIVIDFLQLMSSPSRRGNENRTQEVSTITRAIKAIARELKLPILCLSQLSRAVEQRQSKFPQLSDLRESGEIEQVADLVMFIHREDYYDQSVDNGNVADLIIAKQRNGPTGKVQLTFRKEITRFLDIEKSPVPEQMA